MNTPSVKDRVRAGAVLLDLLVPGWTDRVNIDTLNMRNSLTCILGQVFAFAPSAPVSGNGYMSGLRFFSITHTNLGGVPGALGFTRLDDGLDWDTATPTWNELTEAWKELLAERMPRFKVIHPDGSTSYIHARSVTPVE